MLIKLTYHRDGFIDAEVMAKGIVGGTVSWMIEKLKEVGQVEIQRVTADGKPMETSPSTGRVVFPASH